MTDDDTTNPTDEPAPDFIGDTHPGQTHTVPDVDPENSEKPLAYNVPGQRLSPLWCPDCAEEVNREIEALFESDMENLEGSECIVCGTVLYGDDELVEAYRENREDTHAVDVEYLRALEVLVAYHARGDESVPIDHLREAEDTVNDRGPVLLEASDD